jgi:elongation factor 3
MISTAFYELHDITQWDLDNQIEFVETKFQPYMEPSLIRFFKVVMENLNSPKLNEKVISLGESILKKINPYSFDKISPILFEGMTSLKTQVKLYSLLMLSSFAKIHPSITTQHMPEIITNLIIISNDTRKDIKTQALETFQQVCNTIENVDIKHLIPVIIKAYMNPALETQKALDALVSTPFVNDIDIPTLGFLVPLLTKSMKERKMVFQRRAAVVMETMMKLLKNPVYAKVFYPILEPVLTRGYEEIAEPEIRNVCLNSRNVLTKVYELGINQSLDSFTIEKCRETFTSFLAPFLTSDSGEGVEKEKSEQNKELTDYSIDLVWSLVRSEIKDEATWTSCMEPYLQYVISDSTTRTEILTKIQEIIRSSITIEEYNPEDDEENLCDCVFSLAYGTRVLLHQTPFKVKIGRKYGLVGPNGAGKSTLMKAIANKNLQEFPEELKSVYVEHDIQGNHSECSVLEYVAKDEKIMEKQITDAQIIEGLTAVGFENNMINGPVTALSGGWRMKLALSRAMLLNPDMLLLDEPTNHLDQFAVKWLVDYLKGLTKTTCLIVSHDTRFLDAVCTNITHYENLKLKFYRGNLSDFVKQKPEAKQYYELTNQNVSFQFPEPGPLEGVKSLTKAVLKMKNGYFQYPTAPKPQLVDVSIQVSMASRVAIVGVNGAGKSTLIKILVGELEPNQGIIDRHPNVRVAYVAQHAFHHIEEHLEKTPVEYIMWRYRGGYDKEQISKDALTMSEEELKAIREKAKENKSTVVNEILGRRSGKRENEYECDCEGGLNQWLSKTELVEMGYEKMVKECDERIAMESMLGQRKLTTGEIQKHLDQFGLEPQFAQHSKLGMLSGGQKVKVVLGACMWNLPHIVILDEPTNFLDRDSLGALTGAIKTFKGGLLLISHNEEFYREICPEKWLLDSGRLSVFGSEWMEEVEKARKKAEKENAKKLKFEEEEEKFDSLGNKIEAVKEKKELSRGDKKALLKKKKEMEKQGLDTYEIDKLLGLDD